MNKRSSKEEMGTSLNTLKSIRKVEAPVQLYDAIILRIREQNVVSMSWVRTAAAVLLLAISAEAYTLIQKLDTNKNNSVTELVPTTNNMLYYE